MSKKRRRQQNKKLEQLQNHKINNDDKVLTTNQGLKVNDNQNSLKAGERGASLLEDFILREKITHFDHERIPERVVHARGSAAHGYFRTYKNLKKYTKAKFLNETDRETPVFVRFSTVAGSSGSTDLARDVRGFSVKFYTDEGNYDLVGNNIPVFFIQDAIKFPDLIHAVKPEPDNGIPQAASAHDTFWDFISLMPESMHMIMWVMSDRAIPRSLRMMEGFGVHTFKLINEQGKCHFVKFHWKPVLGVHSVCWDEATQISGIDPDFHRRDLWNAIENGDFPEWELGIQVIPEEDEHKFNFDLLDPTKLVPEETIPVEIIGKMTLNRNPDNFFAETEQVAFHPGHLVPGIDFTNDPLLQGRLFSYTDTQLSRLGSPNFHEIPVNRPINPPTNNQRDAQMRQTINPGKVSYEPNTIANGCPYQAMVKEGGFNTHNQKINAEKVRGRDKGFIDHYSQAKLFYYSQTEFEKNHIANALKFELSKVQVTEIRERMIGQLCFVDMNLAKEVGKEFRIKPKKPNHPNQGVPADADTKSYQSREIEPKLKKSEALSMANTNKDSIKTRVIAFLMADGIAGKSVKSFKTKLEKEGANVHVVSISMSPVKADDKSTYKPKHSFTSSSSVLFDAIYIASGKKSTDKLLKEPAAIHFINQAYKHCKTIGFGKGSDSLFEISNINGKEKDDPSILFESDKNFTNDFIAAIANHRVWDLEGYRNNPA